MTLYEDMEKKMAQEDLFNKEFTVSCVITQNIAMLLLYKRRDTITDTQRAFLAMEKRKHLSCRCWLYTYKPEKEPLQGYSSL